MLKRKQGQDEQNSRKRFARDTEVESTLDGDGGDTEPGTSEYWMVQRRSPQYKKHKTWDEDGVLAMSFGSGVLYDMDGKTISTGKVDAPMFQGKIVSLGSQELQLDYLINQNDFLAGKYFQSKDLASSTVSSAPFAVPSYIRPVPRMDRPKSDGGKSVKPPLQPVINASNAPQDRQEGLVPRKSGNFYWTANWRKQQTKKHKTWDGDAYVSVVNDKVTMLSEEGNIMGTITWKKEPLQSGSVIHLGGMEVQLDCLVDAGSLPIVHGAEPIDDKLDNSKPAIIKKRTELPILPASFYGKFSASKPATPLYDPEAEGAVVMKPPTKEHAKQFNKKNLPITPVVLDPFLVRKMRPHQIEGVKFLYECVMGLRKHEGQGCILADEMGLGKTLQTIALVWTLLKQSPYGNVVPTVRKVLIACPVSLVSNWKGEFHKWLGRDRVGVATCVKDKNAVKTFLNANSQQVLIIGYEKLRTVIDELKFCVPPIGLIICDEGHRLKSANKTAAMFDAIRTPRRVILSGTPIQNDLGEFHAMAEFCNPGLLDKYNAFRKFYEVPILKGRSPEATVSDVQLGEARSAQLLSIAQSFVLRRDARLLMNHLPPKYEYVVFVAPTSLQLSIFTKILNPDNMDDLIHSSTAESLALIGILTKISNSPILLKATIDKVREKTQSTDVSPQRAAVMDALKLLPERTQIDDMTLSGKLLALSRMLKLIRQVRANCPAYTYQSINVALADYGRKMRSSFSLHFDSKHSRSFLQTPPAKRQEYVNAFNKSSQKSSFIFLLSSKAGGVGINLIGASRVCLIDSDWNPSHDLQSMARCHRDGQKRPVYIYRFLTTGTIDEKIFQRQVTKLGLSDSLMGSGASTSKADSFTRRDLRDIFRVDLGTACNTHDLLECVCDRTQSDQVSSGPDDDLQGLPLEEDDDDLPDSGFISAARLNLEKTQALETTHSRKKALAALDEWTHINCLKSGAPDQVLDGILCKLVCIANSEVNSDDNMNARREQTETMSPDVILSDNETTENEQRSCSVMGGTISFLFERKSTSIAQAAEDDQ